MNYNVMKILTKVKIAVPLIIFCITFTGQFFRAAALEKSGLFIFISYSLIVGLVSYFIIDFIMARGHLQRKIKFVQVLFGYFAVLIIINRFILFKPEFQLILTVLISVLIIIIDIFFQAGARFCFCVNG